MAATHLTLLMELRYMKVHQCRCCTYFCVDDRDGQRSCGYFEAKQFNGCLARLCVCGTCWWCLVQILDVGVIIVDNFAAVVATGLFVAVAYGDLYLNVNIFPSNAGHFKGMAT